MKAGLFFAGCIWGGAFCFWPRVAGALLLAIAVYAVWNVWRVSRRMREEFK